MTTATSKTIALPSTTPAVPLPNWTDAGSITGYIVTVATFVVGLLTATGVTVPSGTSTEVQAWAGIAGIAIAAVIQIVNFVRVTVLHKAAILSGQPVAIKPTAKPVAA